MADKPTYEELEKRVMDLEYEVAVIKVSEKRYAANEERMKIALDGTKEGTWSWDMATQGIELDDNWVRILGCKPGEKAFDFNWWQSSMHPESLPFFEEALKDYLEERKKYFEIEYRIKTKSGNWKWVWARGKCVEYDDNGKPLRMIGVHTDITKRKQTEEATESTNRALGKRTHDLGERVKELNCLYGISKLTERLDITLAELFQGTVELISPSWQYPEITCSRLIIENQEFKTKNFRKTEFKQISAIYVNGVQTGNLEVYYLEQKPNINEGSFLKEERNLINAISEQLGRIIERKKAEDLLQSERDKLQSVLNGIGEGMFIVNQNHIVEYQNKALSTYFGKNEGKSCHKVFFQSEKPCDFCLIDETINKRKVQHVESDLINGKTYDISFAPFTDIEGKVKIIVLLRDITEKKNIQAEAMRIGHLASLGELAAGVAHEINNPTNGIISYAEILKDQCDEDGQDPDIPARIIKEGWRIADIVKNLLAFARNPGDEFSPVHIKDVLTDALNLMEKQIAQDGIQMNVDFLPKMPTIKARSQEIQQVFLNILSNARYALNKKFPGLSDSKFLLIKGEAVDVEGQKHIRTTFYDRGTGIPIDIKEKIGDPFFSTKPKGEGTGLGLSISHGIVENHGGKLWFDSKEGEYTKVMVDLPVENG